MTPSPPSTRPRRARARRASAFVREQLSRLYSAPLSELYDRVKRLPSLLTLTERGPGIPVYVASSPDFGGVLGKLPVSDRTKVPQGRGDHFDAEYSPRFLDLIWTLCPSPLE